MAESVAKDDSSNKNMPLVPEMLELGDSDGEDECEYKTWQFVVTGGALIPPANYGAVEEGLYRSGMPVEINFPFLETLHLRTLLHMSTEELSVPLQRFLEDQNINVVKLGEAGKALEPVSSDAVLSAMSYILNPDFAPLYVMCSQGRYRTGTVIGCLRKLQRWSLASVFEEYRRHAERDKVRISTELFIELFDTDLVRIPQSCPTWLHV